MGKRKSSQKAPPKPKNAPLSTSFKCLFCHHDKSVSVKLDKGTMFGHLNCKICGQKYTSPINSMSSSMNVIRLAHSLDLSAAVDVYFDWVDACEEVRLKQPKQQRPKPGPDPLEHGVSGAAISNVNSRRRDGEEDQDAEGEEDDFDLPPPSKKSRDTRVAVDDDDEDVDDDDLADRGKRRRVDYDDDDDDDDDD
ncbi:cell growth-related protein [Papiliotrema laurentii]|uniref:Transcription elongation factor 1 homolog n=1 Tax=Papiliotrema laurentii TaxID=5418 RepID=A0AAD9FRJ6_PAPLA|nr:cell growth-related protein [Papiliotrema laurentii]